MREIKIGVILSYVSIFISNIISILYTPVMLRLLGQSEYGLYTLATSVISYLGLLNFGFGSAYIRFYSKLKVKEDDKGIAELNGMFMAIYCVMAIITVVAGSVLVVNASKILGENLTNYEIRTAQRLMAIMVFNMALSLPASVFSSVITANEKFIFQKSLGIVQTILSPMLMLPLLLLGFRSTALVLTSTILSILSLMVNMIYCIRKLKMKISFRGMSFAKLKAISTFSIFIFINMIVDQINWSVDKVILGRLSGTVIVAIYGIGSQFNSYYITFSSAISNTFIPRVNQMVERGEKEELNQLFLKIGRIQYWVLYMILLGFAFLGKYFIQVWAGEEYVDAFPIALILMIPVTIPLFQNIGIEIQRAMNKHQFRSIVYLCIVIINVCISIPLGARFGGIGCALGTAFSLIVGNIVVMNIYYHKKIGLNMLFFWKQMAKCLPASGLVLVFCMIFFHFWKVNSLLMFLIGGVIYVTAYILIVWYMGLIESEKVYVTQILGRFKWRRVNDRNSRKS